MLLALEHWLTPGDIVLLRGDPQALEPWLSALNGVYAPRRYVLAAPSGLDGLPDALAAKSGSALPSAYVCRGTHCSAQIDSLEALLRELSASGSNTSS